MHDFFEDEPQTAGPEELCRQAFSRCSNWPDDRAGQIGLAQGLKLASERYRITQEELINRCRELSAFCPADADLLKVAAEMFRAREASVEAARDREAEWKRQYGKPEPNDWRAEAAKIQSAAKIYWEKWAKMTALLRQECRRRNRPWKAMGAGEFLQLQVWAQQQVGLPITPEQHKELVGWHGLSYLAEDPKLHQDHTARELQGHGSETV